MCGITAVFAYGERAPAVSREEVEAITAFMRPRGPDAGGTWFSPDGRTGLGSRRLAIIDLTSEGNQPMHHASGELSIVFNGEIYNHAELRTQLERQGVRFHSHSDTEVLLEMYRRYGRDMVELVRGMFAFAIWDARERRLFVARDPYGIKPLYYADRDGTFRAASTVKALLAGGAVSRTMDPAGAAGFFVFGSVPEPFTTCDSIRAVEAGTSFFVTAAGRDEPRAFYSIAATLRNGRERRTIADLTTPEILLRETVSESIAYHLVSDVPVGVFLSAGIDSATLMALALEKPNAPLHSVTLLFDAFRGGEYDESADADSFTRSFGGTHRTRVVTREEFRADLPKIFAAMDQPTIDGVNTWFVSKAAAEQGLKVALSGVGGDELFGSYPSFRSIPRIVAAAGMARRVPFGRPALRAGTRFLTSARLSNPKARAVPELGGSWGGAYVVKRGLFMPSELPSVLPREVAEEGLRRLVLEERLRRILEPDPGSAFTRVAALEASLYMRNQLLRDTDWASMAHSLEVRTPLVDAFLLRQLAPLLAARESRCKDDFAASPLKPLPPPMRARPKTGFMTPIAEWLGLAPDGTPRRARSWSRRVFEQFA